MTTPATAAPAPMAARPATSPPVNGSVDDLVACVPWTWAPGSDGFPPVPGSGYAIAAVEGLAAAATVNGSWERAARLFGAVEALAAANGIAVPAADRAVNERYLAIIRTRLDSATFAATRVAGAALSLDQVIGEALEVSDAVTETAPPSSGEPDITAELTARELDVLRLLAQGLSDRDIAASLFLSPRTIGGHITNLLSKLELESRTAAAVFALRRGLG